MSRILFASCWDHMSGGDVQHCLLQNAERSKIINQFKKNCLDKKIASKDDLIILGAPIGKNVKRSLLCTRKANWKKYLLLTNWMLL